MLTLFDKPECPFCWKIRFALFFKNLSYQQISVDTENKPPELLSLSAKATVPVLLADDKVLDDSQTIMQWLEQYSPKLFMSSEQMTCPTSPVASTTTIVS